MAGGGSTVSTTIDERVVEMRFDNKDFEKNVQTSLKTIDDLKKHLNFDDSTKSVQNLQDSLRHFSIDDIGNALDDLNSKISAGGAMAFGVIQQIGASLVNNVLKVLEQIKGQLHLEDIDQMQQAIAGWNKYGQKTQYVATIMAATGESMEYVSAQMDRLNFFTDETSYSFTDMADNIGKFTANGIALEDASSAMQGIATWAARSGQNAGTASRVMYNLAQAIGMGALKLQDWKSVELANMGTKEFKEAAIQAGLATGTLIEGLDGIKTAAKGTTVTVQNFRETLAEGWMDTDTLMATLQEYGKAAELIADLSDYFDGGASQIIEMAEAANNGKFSIYDLAEALGYNSNEVDANREFLEGLYEQLKLLGSEEYRFSLETYKAAQEARTFGDAMDSVADAVSTGWMKTFELIFGNYEKSKELWTHLANDVLYEIFTVPIEERNERLASAMTSGWEDFTGALNASGYAVEDLQKAFGKLGYAEESMNLIIEKYGSFEEAIRHGAFGSDMLNQAIEKMGKEVVALGGNADSAKMSFQELDALAVKILQGGYGYLGSDRRSALAKEGYTDEEIDSILKYVDARHELHDALKEEDARGYLKVFNQTLKEGTALTDEQIKELQLLGTELNRPGAGDLFRQGLMSSGEAVVAVFKQVRSAFQEAFPPASTETIRNVALQFANAAEMVKFYIENTGIVKNIVSALLVPFQILVELLAGAFTILKPIAKIALVIVSPLIQLIAYIGEMAAVSREVTGELTPFSRVISTVANAIATLLNFVAEVMKYVSGIVKAKLIEKLSGPITELMKRFNSFKEGKIERIEKFIENVKNANVAETGDKIVNKLKDLYNAFKDLKSAEGGLTGFLQTISNLAQQVPVLGSAIRFVTNLISTFSTVMGALQNAEGYSTLQKVFIALKATAATAIGSISEKLKSLGIDTDGIKNKILAIFNSIKEKFPFVETAINSITKLINDFKNHLKGITVEGSFEKVKSISDIFEALKLTATDAITSVKNKLKELVPAFSDVKSNISNLFESIKNFLPKALIAGGAAAGGLGIFAFIKGLFNAKEAAKNGPDLSGIIDSLNPFSDTLGKLKEATSSFNIVTFAVGLGILALALIKMSEVPADRLVTSLGTLGTSLAGFIGTVASINKIVGDKGTLKFVGIGAGMLLISESLILFAKAMDAFKNIDFESGTQIVKTIGLLAIAVSSLKGISKAAGKFRFKASNGVGLIAAVGAIYLFGKTMESYAKLKIDRSNIAKVLGGLLTAIVTLSIISAVAGAAKFKLSNGLGLMALATAMIEFAAVIAILGKLKPETLGQGMRAIATLAAIVVAMTVFIGVVTSFTSVGNGIAGLLLLTGITTAIIGFAAVVVVLGVIPKSMLEKGYNALVVLAITLGVLSAAISVIGMMTGIKSAISGILILTGVVVAIVAFAAVLVTLAVLAIPIAFGIGVLLAILASMLGVFVVLDKFSNFDTKGALITIGEIALFGLALVPLVIVLDKLASMDLNKAADGIALIGKILAPFIIVAGVAGALAAAAPLFIAGVAVISGAVLVFVGSLALLVYELGKLAELDFVSVELGIQCIRDLISICTDLANQFLTTEGLFAASVLAVGTISAFGKALAPLVAEVFVLGLSDAKAAQEAIAPLQGLIDLMVGFANSLKDNLDLLITGKIAADIIKDFGTALFPLAGDVFILGLADAKAAQEAITPLQGLIDLMVGFANTLKDNLDLFVTGQLAAAVILEFGVALFPLVSDTAILGLADAGKVKSNIESMEGLIALLISMAMTVGAEGNFDTLGGAIEIAAMLITFAAALAPLVAVEFVSSLANAEAVTQNMGTISGLIDQFFTIAEKMGSDSTMFDGAKNTAEAIRLFGDALGKLVVDAFVTQFINAQKSADGFEAVKGIVSFMEETAQKFTGENGEELYDGSKKAAEACKKFGEALALITAASFVSQFINAEASTEGFAPAKDMINFLIETAQKFTGENGEALYSGAEKTAGAAKTFATAVAKLVAAEFIANFTDAQKAADAFAVVQTMITTLVDTAKEFNTDGDGGEAMFNAADAAAEACVTFATSLKKLTKAENKISKTDAESAAAGLAPLQTLINILITTARHFARTEGLAQGATDAVTAMTEFSDKLTGGVLGGGIIGSLSKLSGANINADMITSTITSLSSGIVSLAMANGDLSNALAVIDAMDSIFTSLSSAKTTDWLGATTGIDTSGIVNAITNVTNSISELGTAFAEFDSDGFSKTMTSIGEMYVADLSEGIEKNAKDLADAITKMIDEGIKEAKKYDTKFKDTGTNFVKTMTSAIAEEGSKFITKAGDIVSLTIKNLSYSESSFRYTGQNLGYSLLSGFTAYADSLPNTAANIAYNAWYAIDQYENSFRNVGIYLAYGLINGMNSQYSSVVNAASNLGYAAAMALRRATGVRSPSRVFAEIGRYLAIGLANGITDGVSTVEDASTMMGLNAANALNMILDELSDDITEPVITPVLDLSAIRSNVESLNSMMPTSFGLAGRISTQLSTLQNGGMSQQVVSLDARSLAALAASNTDRDITVKVDFEGSLSQLASILQPAIVAETNRRGINLIRE